MGVKRGPRADANVSQAMSPQEVQERLKLNQLKDKIWYVVPSCATTGEGLFEGLVSRKPGVDLRGHFVC
jgi:hypothetical protein